MTNQYGLQELINKHSKRLVELSAIKQLLTTIIPSYASANNSDLSGVVVFLVDLINDHALLNGYAKDQIAKAYLDLTAIHSQIPVDLGGGGLVTRLYRVA